MAALGRVPGGMFLAQVLRRHGLWQCGSGQEAVPAGGTGVCICPLGSWVSVTCRGKLVAPINPSHLGDAGSGVCPAPSQVWEGSNSLKLCLYFHYHTEGGGLGESSYQKDIDIRKE